jgi:hypothetical protein
MNALLWTLQICWPWSLPVRPPSNASGAPRPTRQNSRRLGRRLSRPILTPLAAIGLVVTMIGAIITHARRREYPNVALNVLLAIMAAVAWARFGAFSFSGLSA